MSTINERVPKKAPVECNFWWKPGPALTYTVAGHTYPYVHQDDESSRASDARYKEYTNAILEAITFDATDAAEEGHPKVKTPPGVSIVEYFWDFGDGTTGRGPIVSHTYKVVGSETAVTLTVMDTRGRRYACRKPVNLTFASGEGIFAPSRLRS